MASSAEKPAKEVVAAADACEDCEKDLSELSEAQRALAVKLHAWHHFQKKVAAMKDDEVPISCGFSAPEVESNVWSAKLVIGLMLALFVPILFLYFLPIPLSDVWAEVTFAPLKVEKLGPCHHYPGSLCEDPLQVTYLPDNLGGTGAWNWLNKYKLDELNEFTVQELFDEFKAANIPWDKHHLQRIIKSMYKRCKFDGIMRVSMEKTYPGIGNPSCSNEILTFPGDGIPESYDGRYFSENVDKQIAFLDCVRSHRGDSLTMCDKIFAEFGNEKEKQKESGEK